MGAMSNIKPQTYRDNAGETFTATEVKNDYRKARIVAGQPLTGPEYETGLKNWYSTYTKVTAKEQRNNAAPFVALTIGLAISAVLALMAGAAGGILAFIIVFAIGAFMSMGFSAVVTMFTLPERK